MILPVSSDCYQRALELLQQGRLVAFPTETVYGLGADASQPDAVRGIFAAKQRPADHPLIVHLPNVEQLTEWGRQLSAAAYELAKHFWPGPLTLIVPKAPHVLNIVTGNQNTVGLRVPQHPVAHQLLHQFGKGIAAPSANRFGHVSPTQAQHVQQELGNSVDLIIDGGACPVGIESTIVDVSGKHISVLRPGMITVKQIEDVLGEKITVLTSTTTRAPGMLASHYAPQTALRLIASEQLLETIKTYLAQQQRIAVLAWHDALIKDPCLQWIAMSTEPQHYAHDLYACLRKADQSDSAVILVEQVPQNENWRGISDRLQKAAHREHL